MRAGYFDGAADPSLSLLTLAAALGWAAVALDRPGYGASAGHWPRGVAMPEQAAQVRAAVVTLAAALGDDVPVTLVGHSHGMKVALQLAADDTGGNLRLLSLDLTGVAIRHHPEVLPIIEGEGVPAGRGRELFWGSDALYPAGSFDRATSPVAPVPEIEGIEAPRWPEFFAALAPRVRVPVRWRAAQWERWWETDPASIEEFRAAFTQAPRVDVGVLAHAGHNVSLGWAARAWHLGVLAFAEECLLGG